MSPGGGEEQLLSVKEKTDDAPGFDGHPHPPPPPTSFPFRAAHLSGLVGTRTLEGG